ncbi:esterase FE4-like [Belonocnema kinseyi]|uniref:esterase FE4-like n=1 Tax=Belonocnema kinseyi TaxID=2817044 RepID=UPI00143DDF62|nr:esterase FE4-like [Belonocnema kinseyi]
MKKQLVLFLSLSYFLIVFASHKPLVKVHQGLIRGSVLQSKNGRDLSAFREIPYSQPPIGHLRFSSPLPAKRWDGILSTAGKTSNCVQKFFGEGKLMGNEDCLYLNVYTPVLEFNSSKSKNTFDNSLLPVMVWMHGGGFFFGGGGSYNPKYLLDEDIVLVTINYRLGIIGFLSTGDSVAPGNFGLKDQVLALKWVQQNIEAFGGDPNRVTIFGESAGGASVTLHALSNASDGLFHQYIAQSGSALVPWGYRDRSLFKPDVNSIAKNVGCPTDNSEIIIKCLREKDAFELVNLTSYHVFDFPDLKWIPTNEVESEDAFLTDSPQNLISRNEMRDYPFMTGTVADEGLYITETLYFNSSHQSIKQALDKSIKLSAKHYLLAEDEVKFKEIIDEFYFKKSECLPEDKLLANYTKLCGDTQFIYPNSLLIDKMAEVSEKTFYSYVFGYRGEENQISLNNGEKENIGVTHADDLLYLFHSKARDPLNENDEYIVDVMVDLWTSFATTGKPVSDLLDVPNLWEPYAKQKRFLQIGCATNNTDPSVTLQENYFSDRMNFWKNSFPILVM